MVPLHLFKIYQMRIVSYNLNGIRAAIKKGFTEWLATNPADIICIQETKAARDNVDYRKINELGYEDYWFPAQKKGYSGVAVFTKIKPEKVIYGNGYVMSNDEGRVIQVDFKDFSLINAYFPSGTTGGIRQDYKYQWLAEIQKHLNLLQQTQKNIVLAGDYNIAHTPLDIHDPKGNKNTSGFLPEEREWMTRFLASGWIDTLRHLHPDTPGMYSWWSQRFPSVRLQNKGWRIDYICTTRELEKNIVNSSILPDVKHSDHCPVIVELKF
jgi:exodeoxyribonuclease-3